MNFRITAVVFLSLFIVNSGHAKGKACTADSDCKRKWSVCFEQKCKKLKKGKSLLAVSLQTPLNVPADLFVDDVLVGQLPLEDITTSGSHSLRVEAQGMQTVFLNKDCKNRKREQIQISMQPIPPPPIAMNSFQEPEEPHDKVLPGKFHAGIFGGLGGGIASWGRDEDNQSATTALFGAVAGLRLMTTPIWMDLGFGIAYGQTKIDHWADWGDFKKLSFEFQCRILFSVKDNFLYIGGELVPGYSVSNVRLGYMQLHGTVSLFLNEWLELRANVLGVEYAQELEMRGFIFSFHSTVAAIVRFL